MRFTYLCIGADANTLVLLVNLLDPMLHQSNVARYLLIVGAYRDNEVDSIHPLTMALREVHREGGKVEDLELLALSEEQVIQMLADTFNVNLSTYCNMLS
jgi:predicted ATPase